MILINWNCEKMIDNTQEDFTQSNLDYVQTGEYRDLTIGKTAKLIVPDYGAFFASSVKMVNAVNGLPLNLNVDYKFFSLNEDATKRSNQLVYNGIIIIGDNINAVKFDYHYIGGKYSNGKYLLEQLKTIYPDGIKANIDWDNIANKPTLFPTYKHRHMVKDTYGYDGVVQSLKNITHGLTIGTKKSIQNIHSQAYALIDLTEQTVGQGISDVRAYLASTFESLRVQSGEYIFTDSLEDPSIKRGYGTWTRIKNTVLKGADNDVTVGDGTILSQGLAQPLRNVYIWINNDNSIMPTYTLTTPNNGVLNNVVQVSENNELLITLQTTNVAKGTVLNWVIPDLDDAYLDQTYTLGSGQFVIDQNGQASVKIKFKGNPNSAGNFQCTFMLEQIYGVSIKINVVDTVAPVRVNAYISSDVGGLVPTTRIDDKYKAYLQVSFIGYNVGDPIYLDWSASDVNIDEFEISPPSILNVTSGTMNIAFKLKTNGVVTGDRVVLVYFKNNPNAPITNTTPFAYCYFTDSTVARLAKINYMQNNAVVMSVNEGDSFTIDLQTTMPNTTLTLVYESTKDLSAFNNLATNVTTDNTGRAQINASVIVDYLTNDGVQTLKTNLYAGVYDPTNYIASGLLVIKDTSQTPSYSTRITKPNSDVTVDHLNEGDAFWIRIKPANFSASAYPPLLDLQYGLNGNYGVDASVNARIAGSFHDSLVFSQESAKYDDVMYVNDELIIVMNVIDNEKFDGNTTFNFRMRQDNVSTWMSEVIVNIIDTSVLQVSSGWSTSSVIFNPITQVSEIQSNGLNNTVYLWLTAAGDGSLFGDITLNASGDAANTNVITTFPTVVDFVKGSSTAVVAVTLNPDFMQNGNRTLTISGTYNAANGVATQIFQSSILLSGNNVQTPITVTFSKSSTDPTQTADMFSEYSPYYATLNITPYVYDTVINWTLSGISNGDVAKQYVNTSGTLTVPAGSSTAVITLTPIADRSQDGVYIASLGVQRTLSDGSKTIATIPSARCTLMDDSLPTILDLKFYSDAQRTKEMSNVDEGGVIYARAFISNPGKASYLVANLSYSETTTNNGVNYLGVNSPNVLYRNQGMVLATYPMKYDNVSYTYDFIVNTVKDRTTVTNPQVLEIGIYLPGNVNGRYNVSDQTGYIGNKNDPFITKQIVVNNTSKTPSYTISAGSAASSDRATAFNEGDSFVVSLDVNSGTIGDIFVLMKSNNFDVDAKLSMNSFGVEKILTVDSDRINWSFQSISDRDTFVNNIMGVTVYNKTTGENLGNINITITDVYKTPTLQAYYIGSGTTTGIVNNVPEGKAYNRGYILLVGDKYLLNDDTLYLSDFNGRDVSQFTPAIPTQQRTRNGVTTITTPDYAVKTLPTNDPTIPQQFWGLPGVIIETVPTANKTTDPDSNLFFSANVYTYRTRGTTPLRFNIVDTSKDRKFLNVGWFDVNGNAVTSVTSGQSVVLKAVIQSGTELTSVRCDNAGGRNVGRMDHADYGVSVNGNDVNPALFNFTVSNDFKLSGPSDALLKVLLTFNDTPATTYTASIPVISTTVPTIVNIDFRPDPISNQSLTAVNEGYWVNVVYTILKPPAGWQLQLATASNRTGDGEPNSYTTVTADGNGSDITYTARIRTTPIYSSNGSNQVTQISASVKDMTGEYINAYKATNVNPIPWLTLSSGDITITKLGDPKLFDLSKIYIGNTIRITFSKNCFTNIDPNVYTLYWSIPTLNLSGLLNTNVKQSDGSCYVDVKLTSDLQQYLPNGGSVSVSAVLSQQWYDSKTQYIRATSNAFTVNPTPVINPYFSAYGFYDVSTLSDTQKNILYTTDLSKGPFPDYTITEDRPMKLIVDGFNLSKTASQVTANISITSQVVKDISSTVSGQIPATVTMNFINEIDGKRLYKGVVDLYICDDNPQS